ncbi:MAG TPA: transposase family protein [Methylococcaceae bacterium]|nr:transposase family protein [Methylococcaceae bacterium]
MPSASSIESEKPPRRRDHVPAPNHGYRSPEFLAPLRRIWLASDQLCGKRLKAALPLWLPHYEARYGALPEPVRANLLQVSAATLDRLLKPLRVQYPQGLGGTKPGSLLKTQIPIRTHHWDETLPGFMEADTVAHCGNSLAGDFVWSLTLTDLVSGWTECRATWNKGAHGVLEQIQAIERRLPFPLRGFDCDNGSEFLNHHLLRYFTDHPNKPSFTRSRPYKKNDNAHVEQKNWTHARQLFGYDRLDKPEIVALMNDVYSQLWCPLQNHFCPSLKLKTKLRDGAKYRKTYHPPQTPYQRLLDHPKVPEPTKEALRQHHQQLNPFEIKAQIQQHLKLIFSTISVTPNVRHRL